MLYELFQASFIDELILLEREYQTSSIDDGRTLSKRNSEYIAFQVGTHRYSWERGLLGGIKIIEDKIEYGTKVQSLSCNYAVPKFLIRFCNEFGIAYSLEDNNEKNKYQIRDKAKYHGNKYIGNETKPIILWLKLSNNRLREIYVQSLYGKEQKTLRELGKAFRERIEREKIISVMATELVKENMDGAEQTYVYSVLIGKEGIKPKRTANYGGIKYSEFNLRNLKSDDEMIGLGLAVLKQVQKALLSQSNDEYSFTEPRIEYALMPPHLPEYLQKYTQKHLGSSYATKLSFEANKKNKLILNDWK